MSLPQAAPGVEESLALVCALPDAGRSERRIAAAAMIDRATAVHATQNGARLVFDGSRDTARMVVEFALAERECCAQFTYCITFDPRAESVELRVTAPDHLVEPLKHLYVGLGTEGSHA